MMGARSELNKKLYDMLVKRKYPQTLCDLVTRNLDTDYTASRMIGYLSHYSDLPELEIVDEMIAILSDRDALIQKKVSENAQSKINEIYRFGLDIK